MKLSARYGAAVCLALCLTAWNTFGQTVKASSFGFNPEDATECLQKAFNSGAEKIIVDRQNCDWISGPLFLSSNQEIIFETGVAVRAKKGAFKGRDESLFMAEGCKNIVLRGEGDVRLIMNKSDYQNPELYTAAEWRNCITLLNCENVKIQSLALIESGGDGIYLGDQHGKFAQNYCKDILVEDVEIRDQHRQGISVISAENLVIRNCVMNSTSGTPPAAGIDFEPNSSRQRLVNCLVENCTFENNQGSGVEFFLNNLNANTLPLSVAVKRCTMKGNGGSNINFMQGKNPDVAGEIRFEDCGLFSHGHQSISVSGAGSGMNLTFRNLAIDNSRNPLEAVLLSSGFDTMGKMLLDNVAITDEVVRPAIGISLYEGRLPRKINAFGTVALNGKPFDVVKCCRDYEELSGILKKGIETVQPSTLALAKKQVDHKPEGSIAIRSEFTFYQYCKSGDKLDVIISTTPIGKNRKPITVAVYAPGGKELLSGELAPGDKYTVDCKAKKTGLYRIDCNPGGTPVRIKSGAAGQALVHNTPLNLIHPEGHLYFQVPAGVKDFSLMIAGDPREYLTAAVTAPDGTVAAQRESFCTPSIFKVTRTDSTVSEIWSLNFTKAREDVTVVPLSGIRPVFAFDPANLLLAK